MWLFIQSFQKIFSLSAFPLATSLRICLSGESGVIHILVNLRERHPLGMCRPALLGLQGNVHLLASVLEFELVNLRSVLLAKPILSLMQPQWQRYIALLGWASQANPYPLLSVMLYAKVYLMAWHLRLVHGNLCSDLIPGSSRGLRSETKGK